MNLVPVVSRNTLTKKTRITGLDQPWKTVRNQFLIIFIAYCIVDKVANDPSCGMFALFDGHGGRQVSEHCADRFPVEVRKEM